MVKTFLLEKNVVIFFQHAEEDPCHVVLKPRRLEPMFKMADRAGEMCRRNLGFQPSKKTAKGQFFIFLHGKVLLYTYSLNTIRNFHMTTEQNEIFIAVETSCRQQYKLRGRRGPIMFRSFSHLG